MATFTEQLGVLVENGFEVWDAERPYPIFDEAYRGGLNQRIIDHFYLYEIGQETPWMFRFALNRKMREIMPYYNTLYRADLSKVDPFSTVDLRTLNKVSETGTTADETHSTSRDDRSGKSSTTTNLDGFSNTSSAQTTNADSQGRVVSSDTPQTRLAGNEDYATGVNDSHSKSHSQVNGAVNVKTTDKTTTSGASEDHGTGAMDAHGSGEHARESEGEQRSTGRSGSYASLFAELQSALINIDVAIMNELTPLFMQVWDNGDEFSATHPRGYGYARPYYTI